MNSSFKKAQKRKLISSYFSVVLSIFLVLFLLGFLGLFVINSEKLANNFREKIVMTVFFKNAASASELESFAKKLKQEPYTKSFQFVSKEKAAKQHADVIGEDFIKFIGENPLENSYDVRLKAEYVVRDSISKIEKNIKTNQWISDIVYDKQLINLVNDNIKKVSMWILITTGFFTIISVLLINSSLRLSVYSNRFIIKTMQMVGATKSFIRRPFIQRSLNLGMIGAGLSIIALVGVLFYVDSNFPNLEIFADKTLTISLMAALFGLGVLISWLSTYFATQRFLNLKTDELY